MVSKNNKPTSITNSGNFGTGISKRSGRSDVRRSNGQTTKVNNKPTNNQSTCFNITIPDVRLPIPFKYKKEMTLKNAFEVLDCNIGKNFKYDLFKKLIPFIESVLFDFNEQDDLKQTVIKAAELIDQDYVFYCVDTNEVVEYQVSYNPYDTGCMFFDLDKIDSIKKVNLKLYKAIKLFFAYVFTRDVELTNSISLFYEYTKSELFYNFNLENETLEYSDICTYLKCVEDEKLLVFYNSVESESLQLKRAKLLRKLIASGIFNDYGLTDHINWIFQSEACYNRPYKISDMTLDSSKYISFENRDDEGDPLDWQSLFLYGRYYQENEVDSYSQMLGEQSGNYGVFLNLNVFGKNETIFECDDLKHYMNAWSEIDKILYEEPWKKKH